MGLPPSLRPLRRRRGEAPFEPPASPRGEKMALALVLAAAAAAAVNAAVYDPDCKWRANVTGWLFFFDLVGCVHCSRSNCANFIMFVKHIKQVQS